MRRLVRDAFATGGNGYQLILASQQGMTQDVKELLRDGANPNYNLKGETPLKAARRHHYDRIVKLLLQAEAKD